MNIRTDIDYVNESFALLFSIGTGKTLSEKIENRIKTDCSDKDAFYKEQEFAISVILQIEDEVKKMLQPDWDEFIYYYGQVKIEEFSDSLGRILVLWDEFKRNYVKSFKEFKKSIMAMTDDDYREAFSEVLQGIFDTLRDSSQFSELKTDEDIIRNIIGLSLPTEAQITLEDFYLNRDKHLSKALVYAEATSKILKTHEKELKTLIKNFQKYWEDRAKSPDFTTYLKKNYMFFNDFPDNKYGDIITPSIFYPFIKGACISFDDDLNPTEMYYYPVGILYCHALPLDFSRRSKIQKLDQESCLNILKLISEPTRLEILSGIAKEPAFGNELAQRLSLTTATVSHHMNLLIKANLVKIRQEGTRIYYESKPETLKMCFSKIRQDFIL